jgi:hypothetical protein
VPRAVTFYRLETGQVHTVRVPDHGVLRKRTIERLAKGLGYRTSGRPGLSAPQIADAVQLTERRPRGVDVVELEVPPADGLSPGSVALRFRPATLDDVAQLHQSMDAVPDEANEGSLTAAEQHIGRLLAAIDTTQLLKGSK